MLKALLNDFSNCDCLSHLPLILENTWMRKKNILRGHNSVAFSVVICIAVGDALPKLGTTNKNTSQNLMAEIRCEGRPMRASKTDS